MDSITENNKRIARNTLFLYFRMFILMVVTLFTSRVVLRALGINDYGVYNLVAGVIAMMGILNNAMAVSSQRYLTFELGRKDYKRLQRVFSVSFSIYLFLALIFLFLAETVGLWFLNTQLIIPKDRIVAANCIYQFTIIASISSLLTNPYNACIIAHEKMSVFAYVSIVEVMLKLGVAYLIYVVAFDKLIVYGAAIMFVSLIITAIYRYYCISRFQECKYHWVKDKVLFKELSAYSGWNLFGSASGIVKSQGINILLNIFFGPAINGARAIVYQIETAIYQFFANFYTAVRPQITKYYAEEDLENMFKLVFRSSLFSFYLMLLVSLPILLETNFIVQLWLGQVPEYVVIFTRLIIANVIIDAIAAPLMTTIHATGRIALYQFLVGTTTILNIPITYILLKLGYSPYCAFYVSIFISIICMGQRLWIARRLVRFPVLKYFTHVLLRSLGIGILAMLIPSFVQMLLPEEGFFRFIIVSVLCIFTTIFVVYFLGMTNNEQAYLKNRLLKNKK